MRQGTRSCRTGVCVTTPLSSAGDFCGRSWGIVQPSICLTSGHISVDASCSPRNGSGLTRT
jgi:hypothetical protein